MPPRATWKGFLNLSLVSVAVKAFSATNESSKIRLNQLHTECHSRIRHEKTCPIHGAVSNDEIVKGYEFAKEQYVVIDLDELDQLRTQEESRCIRIGAFVSPDKFDSIYLSGTSYYLAPDGAAGQKPFALIHQAMTERNLYCIAQVVLAKREQVVLIRPMGKTLCMSVLRYATQVKSDSFLDEEFVETKVSDQEMSLAKMLIDETTRDEIDLTGYRDEYTEKLQHLIDSKVKGEELVAAPTAEPKHVINLMDALKASVEEAQRKPSPVMKKAARTTKKKKTDSSTETLKQQLARKPTPKKKSAKGKKKTG